MAITTIRLVNTAVRAVALTFDDGPHTVYTPRALEALAKYSSQATWFIIGRLAQSRMNLLYDIYQGGNDIGVHAYDHISLTSLSYSQTISQLGRTRALIEEVTGRWWPYFRPPNGAFNQSVLNAASQLGFQYNVLWSVDPRDYDVSAGQIVGRVLNALFPGAIVILHEVLAPTGQALPLLLMEMERQGYQAVTLSHLLELANPGQKHQA